MQPSRRWQDEPARRVLLEVYEEADAAVADFSCDASTECCRFRVTGREPYVTAVELAEIRLALAATGGGVPKKRSLKQVPAADDGRCPLLDDAGRCRIYRSRPLGCRTFFCSRARGPKKAPREALNRLANQLADLSLRTFPGEPPSRPLTRALGSR